MKKLLLLFFTLLSFHSFATEYYLTCEECSTSSDFLQAAETYGPDRGNYTIVVFNFNTEVAKKYQKEWLDSDLGSGEMLISAMSTPAYANNAVQYYKDIVNDLDVLDLKPVGTSYYPTNKSYILSGESAVSKQRIGTNADTVLAAGSDGCTGVPDLIFLSACQAHDSCYEGTAKKSVCDRQFLDDMLDAIQDAKADWVIQTIYPYSISSALGAFTKEAAYTSIAYGYFLGVTTIPEAKTRYCNSTQRYYSIECGSSSGNPNGEYVRNETVYVDLYMTASCELWKFPDGNGSFYYMYRKCEYMLHP
jgi:hypothetical protein